jgi:uncharacterized membrane protein
VNKLRAFWTRLAEGLWFVPGIIVLGSILLAVAMVELSAAVGTEALARWPRVFGVGAEGARSMLAAIAGSMITVAGVMFSITMVAVTQASSQYTPRILRNFMRDRANQVVLGVFVGVFVYCLVVLRTIRGGDDPGFVPSLAVLLGVLLAIAGVAVLIFFVHHIATTLQASEIVARISRETVETAERLYPDALEEQSPAEASPPEATAPSADRWHPVEASATGYIQAIDLDGLARLSRDRDLFVRLDRQVGEFVIAGLPLAAVARPAGHDRAPGSGFDGAVAPLIAARVTVGNYRTNDQDVSFGIRQLVDIALKALSPGINDTTTAVTCVHHLGAILADLAARRIEAPRRSEDGVVRVLGQGPGFESLVQSAFDQVRQNAEGNVSVLSTQLSTLELLVRRTPSRLRRDALLQQVGLVEEAAERTVPSAHDREGLARLARLARAAQNHSPAVDALSEFSGGSGPASPRD